MLEYIGVAIIAVGIYLVIRGLSEREENRWIYEERLGERRLEEIGREDESFEVKGGGVVLIGPIPIVFGDSKYASLALILAIILMLLSIAFWVIVQ